MHDGDDASERAFTAVGALAVLVAAAGAVALVSGAGDRTASLTTVDQPPAAATVALVDAEPPGAPDLPPLRLPPPGRYVHDAVGTGADGSRRAVHRTRHVVHDSGDERPGEVTVVDPDVAPVAGRVLDISAAGAFVVATLVDTVHGQVPCFWEPAWPHHTGLSAGQRFSFDSRCQSIVGNSTVRMSVRGSGRVRGTAWMEVFGDRTPVWVVDRFTEQVVDVREATSTARTIHSESRVDHLDPLRGIVLRSEVATTVERSTIDEAAAPGPLTRLRGFERWDRVETFRSYRRHG